jgi:acetyltransferase-like isoleucine patch superfamily enzyme
VNLNPRRWAQLGQQALRVWLLRLSGATVGRGTRVEAGVVARRGWTGIRPGRVIIAPECELDVGVVLDAFGGEINLGKNVFLGPYAVIYGHGSVSIGDHTLVAMHCQILSSNHAVPPFGTDIRSQPDVLLPTRVGRDVWLGAGVTILGGVSVGDGCVIGAGSVVTKSLPPGAIAFGSPAAIKGFRDGRPAPFDPGQTDYR